MSLCAALRRRSDVLAAIVDFALGEIDETRLDRLAGSARTGSLWRCGPAGIVASRLETSPAFANAPEQELALGWDGRLDDREALVRVLGLMPEARLLGDAALVLHAFRERGREAVALLTGDFAFVLWDGRSKEFFAVRDPLGVRQLHYAVDGSSWLLASRVSALSAASGVRRAERTTVCHFLCGAQAHPASTFLKGVRRIPAGQSLRIAASSYDLATYWHPATTGSFAGTDAELTSELARVLVDAVADRLDPHDDTGLLLSGGVDSAAVAHALARSRVGQAGRKRIGSFTATLELPGSPDRRARVAPVSAAFDLDAKYVESEPTWVFNESTCDEPVEGMWASTVFRLLREARSCGVSSLLTGFGGDAMFAGSVYYLLDLMFDGKWRVLARELSGVDRSRRRMLVVDCFLKPALLGLGPSGLRAPRPPEWLGETLRAELDAVPRGRRISPRLRSSQAELDAVQSLRGAPQLVWYGSLESDLGVELRHPFLDRRVVEFALSLPAARKVEGGRSKAPLRRLLRGPLSAMRAVAPLTTEPASARDRLRQREERLWRACFADSVSADLGYVDISLLTKAFLRYQKGDTRMRFELARAYRLEHWLKRINGAIPSKI